MDKPINDQQRERNRFYYEAHGRYHSLAEKLLAGITDQDREQAAEWLARWREFAPDA